MNSREEYITWILNSIPIRGATSHDSWTKLISDYFTTPVGDSGAETDSGLTSESDSGDLAS